MLNFLNLLLIFLVFIIIGNLCANQYKGGNNVEERLISDVFNDSKYGKFDLDLKNINESKKQTINDSLTILFKKDSDNFYNLNNDFDKYIIESLLNKIFINGSEERNIKTTFENNLKKSIIKIYKQINIDIDKIDIKNIKINNEKKQIGLIYNYYLEYNHNLNKTDYNLKISKLKNLFNKNLINFIKYNYLQDNLLITQPSNSDIVDIEMNQYNNLQYKFNIAPGKSGIFTQNQLNIIKPELKEFIKKYFDDINIKDNINQFVLEDNNKTLVININFYISNNLVIDKKIKEFVESFLVKQFLSNISQKSLILYDFIDYEDTSIESYIKNIYVPNDKLLYSKNIIEEINIYDDDTQNYKKIKDINSLKINNKNIIKLPKLVLSSDTNNININIVFTLNENYIFVNQLNNRNAIKLNNYANTIIKIKNKEDDDANAKIYEIQFYNDMYEHEYKRGNDNCNEKTNFLEKLVCYNNTVKKLPQPVFLKTNYNSILKFYTTEIVSDLPDNLTNSIKSKDFISSDLCNNKYESYSGESISTRIQRLKDLGVTGYAFDLTVGKLLTNEPKDVFFNWINNSISNPSDKYFYIKQRILSFCKDLIKNNKLKNSDIEKLSKEQDIDINKIYAGLKYLSQNDRDINEKYGTEIVDHIKLDNNIKTYEFFRFNEMWQKLKFLRELYNSNSNDDVKWLLLVQIHISNDKYNNKIIDYDNINRFEYSQIHKLIHNSSINIENSFKNRYYTHYSNCRIDHKNRPYRFIEFMKWEKKKTNTNNKLECSSIFMNTDLDDEKLYKELKKNNCLNKNVFKISELINYNKEYLDKQKILIKDSKKLLNFLSKNKPIIKTPTINQNNFNNIITQNTNDLFNSLQIPPSTSVQNTPSSSVQNTPSSYVQNTPSSSVQSTPSSSVQSTPSSSVQSTPPSSVQNTPSSSVQNTPSTLRGGLIISEESDLVRDESRLIREESILPKINLNCPPCKRDKIVLNNIKDFTDFLLYTRNNPNISLDKLYENEEDEDVINLVNKISTNVKLLDIILLDNLINNQYNFDDNRKRLNEYISNLDNILIFVSDLIKNKTNTSKQKDYLDILYFIVNKLINDFNVISDILVKSSTNKKSLDDLINNKELKGGMLGFFGKNNQHNSEIIVEHKSKNDKSSADEIMKLIYTYTHKNPDNLEPTEPLTDSILFMKLLKIYYKYNKNNLNKMTKILNHLKTYHYKEFESFKSVIEGNRNLLDIYEKIKNNSVVKPCPREQTSNEDDDNIDTIDVKLIYKRNEELQKNLEILKNENENLRINLDNCKNNIHQINRAYAIAARRGGSNISLSNKKINQTEELKKQKDYMIEHIKSKNKSKEKEKTKCTTDACKANEMIQENYKNTIDLANQQNNEIKKNIKKKCRKNDKCDMCGVLKNTSSYELLNKEKSIETDNNEEIDYNLPLCSEDCSKCDDIDGTVLYKSAYDSELLKEYNKDYDISKVKFYKDIIKPKTESTLLDQYKVLSKKNNNKSD